MKALRKRPDLKRIVYAANPLDTSLLGQQTHASHAEVIAYASKQIHELPFRVAAPQDPDPDPDPNHALLRQIAQKQHTSMLKLKLCNDRLKELLDKKTLEMERLTHTLNNRNRVGSGARGLRTPNPPSLGPRYAPYRT